MQALRVFFSPNQSVPDNDSFSPSAGKPAKLLEYWRDAQLPIEVVAPKPATRKDLHRAHDRDYVTKVLACLLPNGFDNTLRSVAASLPWTSGSMIGAALDAIENGEVAVSLSSGFHHAGYDFGGGFCTFNGLMVTAQKLHDEGRVKTIGIIDLDQHYGNGTQDIIDRLGLDYVRHYTLGATRVGPGNADQWLEKLPGIIEKQFSGCDLVLYQAGADPHVDDPLGGRLTTAQMARRDEIVFSTLKRLGIPVAWNLAGGYQQPIEKVLKLHTNTAKKCLQVFGEG